MIESKHRLEEQLAHLHERLARGARYRLLMARQQLTELAQHGAFRRIQDLLARRAQRLDELIFRLATGFQSLLREYGQRLEIAGSRVRHFDFRRQLALTRSSLESANAALLHTMRARLASDRARWEQIAAKLDALSPIKILDRGYALVFDANGALVKDARLLKPGQEVTGRVARGSFVAEIKKTE